MSETFSVGSKSIVTENNSLEEAHPSEKKNSLPQQEGTDIETIVDFQNDVDDESDDCGEQQLRIRKTPSFRCFIKIEMSHSSLLKSKLFHFPPLEDPGIDEVYFFQGKYNDFLRCGSIKIAINLHVFKAKIISFCFIVFQKVKVIVTVFLVANLYNQFPTLPRKVYSYSTPIKN